MALTESLHRLRTAASILQPRQLALRGFRCPMCGPSVLLRLSREAFGVRCMRCAASAAALSLACAVKELRPGFRTDAVYEMSSRGPWLRYLQRKVARLTYSEYFDDVRPGDWRGGVQCQTVHGLTYVDASFDLCTSTEVFEHVADDARGFAEIRRVLRPGGLLLFTVPLSTAGATVERAAFENGRVRHFLPPAYHGDHIRGRDKVLVYRDYGLDIADRLRRAGFDDAWIEQRYRVAFLGQGSAVIAARAP